MKNLNIWYVFLMQENTLLDMTFMQNTKAQGKPCYGPLTRPKHGFLFF